MPESNEINPSIVVVVLGAPGAGKGTQCLKLAKALDIPHISTGSILRNHIDCCTELGQRVRKIVDTGDLVPDSFVLDILDQRIKQLDCAKGFILDGFPRTLAQAVALNSRFCSLRQSLLPIVIQLIVPEYSLVRRLCARRVCPSCGASYRTRTDNAVSPEICNQDGSALVVRADDLADTVTRRLVNYQHQISPVLHHYRSCGTLVTIDGDQAAQCVTAEILDQISSLRKCVKPSMVNTYE